MGTPECWILNLYTAVPSPSLRPDGQFLWLYGSLAAADQLTLRVRTRSAASASFRPRATTKFTEFALGQETDNCRIHFKKHAS